MTLGLAWNSLGIEGVKHLSNALEQNTVRSIVNTLTEWILAVFTRH